MNWRRILAAIAVGGFLIFVTGFIWTGPMPKSGQAARHSYSEDRGVLPFRAITTLELKRTAAPDNESANTILWHPNKDIETYLRILESRQVSQKVIASYSPDELFAIWPSFRRGRPISFDVEVVFELDRKNGRLSINAIHPDANGAVLIAQRYTDAFLQAIEQWDESRRQLALTELSASRQAQLARIVASKTQRRKAEQSKDAEAIERFKQEVERQSGLLEITEEKITRAQRARFALEFELQQSFSVEKLSWLEFLASGPR